MPAPEKNKNALKAKKLKRDKHMIVLRPTAAEMKRIKNVIAANKPMAPQCLKLLLGSMP